MNDLGKRAPERPELEKLIEESKRIVAAMTEEEKTATLRKQAESWAIAEANWPKPRFKYVNGVKVYESYEDYCND